MLIIVRSFLKRDNECVLVITDDCVFVITDRYSRYTIAIPTYKSLTGEGAAQLFFEHVVLIHGRGLPISIFSDRDPRFVSAFFTEFFTLCGVKLSTTSGYRSTSNGLVERRNQDLEARRPPPNTY